MTKNARATKSTQNGNADAGVSAEMAQLPTANSVHIAGVGGSSPSSPTTSAKSNQYVRPRAIQCAVEQTYHIKRIRELFAYDPEDGVLYRRRTWKRAGRKMPSGYYCLQVDGVEWREHRIVWEWVNGVTLTENDEIDHIDGDRGNNRIENLRKATRAENQWNAKVRKDNTSGFKGVSWNKKSQRWTANISINGKVTYLGAFPTAEEAHEAYTARARELRGSFARVK